MSKKRQPMGAGRWAVLLICAIVFTGCLAYLGLWVKENMTAQKDFRTAGRTFHNEEKGLAGLYDENRDVIGWVSISDTGIDYPVMQTADDPEYYLYRDFSKAHSESGTPFMDAASRTGYEPTWNWMIYGHNMKFGTMFHDLLEYDSREFWENHRILKLQVITGIEDGIPVVEKGEYEIFAAARSKIRSRDSAAFKYYAYAGFEDKESFNVFVDGVRSEALYDTGVVPEFGEQLVTLSTCAYHEKNGRFYVVATKR